MALDRKLKRRFFFFFFFFALLQLLNYATLQTIDGLDVREYTIISHSRMGVPQGLNDLFSYLASLFLFLGCSRGYAYRTRIVVGTFGSMMIYLFWAHNHSSSKRRYLIARRRKKKLCTYVRTYVQLAVYMDGKIFFPQMHSKNAMIIFFFRMITFCQCQYIIWPVLVYLDKKREVVARMGSRHIICRALACLTHLVLLHIL